MREIKFRYRLKHLTKKGYEYFFLYHTLPQLEGGAGATTAEVVARDQYTGLKDKNGKEIYEGDIVEFDHEHLRNPARFVYVFDDGCFCQQDKERRIDTFYGADEIEVIGNIYENPELLGG